ncbi:MAG TPA: Co2+/Mg2+ efflux protein ApaG [Saprospiraceae bacterium]|nr:Co2+/Mg2+ efflux protein ApaG [Saprospiraceae bacterium]HMP23595.1 Co2+/Mg2+ efflux protein ApaG [Saprospiraceae bacterium]
METLITNGIKVSVETFYQPSYSRPMEMKYVFSYHIYIENLGSNTVQLLRREWLICDSSGLVRKVEGEGVIGKQPVLAPGESHQYASWSPLMTEIGKMTGAYIFRRDTDGQEFRVNIPEFRLIAPFKLN